MVRINEKTKLSRLQTKVVFAQPGMGMGLAFGDAEPDQRAILDQWIAEQSGEPVKARIFLRSTPDRLLRRPAQESVESPATC